MLIVFVVTCSEIETRISSLLVGLATLLQMVRWRTCHHIRVPFWSPHGRPLPGAVTADRQQKTFFIQVVSFGTTRAKLPPSPAKRAPLEVGASREAPAENWADMNGVAEVAREEEWREDRQVLDDYWDAQSCSNRRSRKSEERSAATQSDVEQMEKERGKMAK